LRRPPPIAADGRSREGNAFERNDFSFRFALQFSAIDPDPIDGCVGLHCND
jgi:hypothetical protein